MTEQKTSREWAAERKALKRGPRPLKSGKPGLKGRARLVQRMRGLIIALNRFQQKASFDDAEWCQLSMNALRTAVLLSDEMDNTSRSRDESEAVGFTACWSYIGVGSYCRLPKGHAGYCAGN